MDSDIWKKRELYYTGYGIPITAFQQIFSEDMNS